MGRLKLPSQRNKPPKPPVVIPPIVVKPPMELPPPIRTSGGLRVSGRFFTKSNGDRTTLIGCSDFSMFKRYIDQDSETLDPTIENRQELEFNILRVWLLNTSVVSFRNRVIQDGIHPSQYPAFYEVLHNFCNWLDARAMNVELTVFTQTATLMPNPDAQQSHLDRTSDAVRGLNNVILELVNENDQHDNTVYDRLTRPLGVIISHGSNGADATGVRPTWDYELYHSNDLSEFQRKVGHNAMEKADESGVPCWSNENTRYPDKDSNPNHAYDAAMGAALLCAGSCFHSQSGKWSIPLDPMESLCAQEWVRGAKSVPLIYQSGQYNHRTDLENANIIRAYDRRLVNGQTYPILIRNS